MLVFDINTYLKDDTTMKSLCNGDVSIQPLVGTDGTVAPYILYWVYNHNKSQDLYWWHQDLIKYQIWDTDVERLLKIGERMIELLNKADHIQQSIPTDKAPKYSFLARGSMDPPDTRNGWYGYQIIFEIGWL